MNKRSVETPAPVKSKPAGDCMESGLQTGGMRRPRSWLPLAVAVWSVLSPAMGEAESRETGEASASPDAARAVLLSVRRIWDGGEHNAFTDLTWFQDRWHCCFREAKDHVSPDGRIRILESVDGESWISAAEVVREDADLRDPGFSITPDGRLMLTAAASWHEPSDPVRRQSMTWCSADGRTWDEGTEVGEPDFWLWKTTWNQDAAFGFGYNGYAPEGERCVRLYRSADGRRFETLVPSAFKGGYPNEAKIRFREDGVAVCLLRRDGDPATGLIGEAAAPYEQWEWKDLGVRIGGPNLLQLPGGSWVACVRLYDGQVRTALCGLDLSSGQLEEWLALPSGGDTSYAGLAWRDERLWISYYSSHEGKTSIYLAQVRVRQDPSRELEK